MASVGVIYVSDHGFGHTVRCVFLAAELIRQGVRCHFVCDRPDWLFASLPAGGFEVHRRTVDAGLVQSDWLRIDPQATLERYRRRLGRPEDAIEAEAAFLRGDRKSTRLNSSHSQQSRMPSSA